MAVDAAKVAEKYEGGSDLTAEESRFLQDRGVPVDDPQPVVFKLPGGGTVSNDPTAILSNLQEQQGVDLEAEVERRVEAELARRAAAALHDVQHQQIVEQTPHTGTANPNSVPAGGTDAGVDDGEAEDDDEEGDDYEDGWNNDERRAELARRNLSTIGNKEALVARLVRSDNDELEEEDQA